MHSAGTLAKQDLRRMPHRRSACVQAGELVEVSNASHTDPCAWLVRVGCIQGSSLVVRLTVPEHLEAGKHL